jgi:gamma-glutamyl-gamma-aminobutyrate hydrolase PuuD
MRPLVGVAAGLFETGPGTSRTQLDRAYTRALEESGAAPVLLPIQADPGDLVRRISGLVVPGGPDFVPPAPYPPTVEFDAAAPEQLAFDAALIQAALERRMPFLGICWGMQLLARELGGSLHHHLPLDLAGAGPHKIAAGDLEHGLRVEPGTRLARLLGPDADRVNSRHHQAVADPGPALRVSARADDGVVEALESPDAPFCVGVQWHPERMDALHRRALFGGFVAACRS